MSASLMSAAARRLMPVCAGVVLALAPVRPTDALAQSAPPFAVTPIPAVESSAGSNFVVTFSDVAAVAAFVRNQGQGIATGEAEPEVVRVPRPSEIVLPVASHFVVTQVDVAEVAAYVIKTIALARADRPVDPRRFASIVLPKTARPKAGLSAEFAELQVGRSARGSRVVRF